MYFMGTNVFFYFEVMMKNVIHQIDNKQTKIIFRSAWIFREMKISSIAKPFKHDYWVAKLMGQ